MAHRTKMYIKKLLLAGGLFLAAALALLWAARRLPGFADWYAAAVYPLLVKSAGRLCGLFPFSVAELGLYAGIFSMGLFVFRFRKTPLFTVSGVFCAVSVLLFLYAAGCGVNYYRQPFSAYVSWNGSQVGAEELHELCRWLTERVNEAREELEEAEDSYEDMGSKGVRAMEKLSRQYPQLAGYYPAPKPVLISWILSVQQYSGVYSPFTIEANYNRDMVDYNIPHTICHELSHLRGFMREDEANFIGYLACRGSDSADYRYSGYLLGWIYAGNALAGEDYEEYARLYGELSEAVRADLKANNEFWDRYEGQAAEAASRVNDAYLKANGQPEGVRTYGRVVDLMIREYIIYSLYRRW